jgi:hypothetical protein
MISKISLYLCLLLLVGGCVSSNSHGVSLSRSLTPLSPIDQWYWEASHRFKNPYIFVCHGNSISNDWYCFPDYGQPMNMDSVANMLKAEHPNRPIVLCVCNPQASKLHVTGVYYSREDVWTPPWYKGPRINNFIEGGP